MTMQIQGFARSLINYFAVDVGLFLSLSLLLCTAHPPAIDPVPSRIVPFPIGQPSPLDSYITSYPFAVGSLIALMMEAERTSETSVVNYFTWQYIPEEFELHVF
jgi:hypothetical protein